MRRLLTFLAIAGFLGLVFWDLSSQGQVECNVCVEFKGQVKCALGSGLDRQEALRAGHTPACQQLTSGVTEAFACTATPPLSVTCEGD